MSHIVGWTPGSPSKSRRRGRGHVAHGEAVGKRAPPTSLPSPAGATSGRLRCACRSHPRPGLTMTLAWAALRRLPALPDAAPGGAEDKSGSHLIPRLAPWARGRRRCRGLRYLRRVPGRETGFVPTPPVSTQNMGRAQPQERALHTIAGEGVSICNGFAE